MNPKKENQKRAQSIQTIVSSTAAKISRPRSPDRDCASIPIAAMTAPAGTIANMKPERANALLHSSGLVRKMNRTNAAVAAMDPPVSNAQNRRLACMSELEGSLDARFVML